MWIVEAVEYFLLPAPDKVGRFQLIFSEKCSDLKNAHFLERKILDF